jgi:RimJ/RimL family protein N-acetyltransferase
MTSDYAGRVRSALASLAIPADLIARRSLALCEEAVEVVLAEIGEDGRQFMLIPLAAQAWKEMATAAARDGATLRLASAFRSLDRQVEILRGKLAEGVSLDEVLRESAPPGYSEHHTGRAIDITTPGSDALEEEFETTAAFGWLQRRAHEFGFSLSFPRGNRFGYAYEPWHWFYRRPTRIDCGPCVVRNWRRSDKAALLRHADNRRVWRNLTHLFPHPYTEADAENWFVLLESQLEPTHWAIEVQGEAAGSIGCRPGQGVYERSAQFGYWLGEAFWGHGIVTAAVKAMVPCIVARFGMMRLESPVFEWNPASMRVLEKCGFQREGLLRASISKDGRIIDQVLYAYVVRAD